MCACYTSDFTVRTWASWTRIPSSDSGRMTSSHLVILSLQTCAAATYRNSIKGKALCFENGLLHHECWDLTCSVTQGVWYSFSFQGGGEERRCAGGKPYKRLRSINWHTRGYGVSALLETKTASRMFWRILTRCGLSFQNQRATNLWWRRQWVREIKCIAFWKGHEFVLPNEANASEIWPWLQDSLLFWINYFFLLSDTQSLQRR